MIVNTCLFNDNEILIEAPGDSNSNIIKSSLILGINSFLSPDSPKNANYEFGGTMLKNGSKYKNIRFDVGTRNLFHMNTQLAKKNELPYSHWYDIFWFVLGGIGHD